MIGKVLQVFLELLLAGVYPIVGGIGNPVELKDRDSAVLGLTYGFFEIIELPGRTSVASGRNQQRVIPARLVGEPSALLIRILGTAAPPGGPNAHVLEDRQGGYGQG